MSSKPEMGAPAPPPLYWNLMSSVEASFPPQAPQTFRCSPNFPNWSAHGFIKFRVTPVSARGRPTFAIDHDKNGADTRWYSDLVDGSIIDSASQNGEDGEYSLYVGIQDDPDDFGPGASRGTWTISAYVQSTVVSDDPVDPVVPPIPRPAIPGEYMGTWTSDTEADGSWTQSGSGTARWTIQDDEQLVGGQLDDGTGAAMATLTGTADGTSFTGTLTLLAPGSPAQLRAGAPAPAPEPPPDPGTVSIAGPLQGVTLDGKIVEAHGQLTTDEEPPDRYTFDMRLLPPEL